MTAVALHHRIDGPDDAPPLLLGGSLGTDLSMWEPQLSALVGPRRVIRLDTRGHGGSPVPAGPYSIADLGGDVLALMDRLELSRAAYCGLSIGGMVGQWLGINAPDRITELILLCTGAHVPPRQQWLDRAAAVREAGSPEPIADAVVARWFTPQFASAHPDVVGRHRRMLVDAPAEGYAGCCEAIGGLDARADLPSIAAPTLVVSGAQDPSIPADHGRAIAAAVPGARLEVLDPAAHLASVERADAVSGLIREHLGIRAG
ncbi:MAG: 3-oxoadipate enol-lactonase [Solirubrobacterales bacterium]|nr:3-oxoadipate enol-lactonase [Solirubrobacterales bacterium]